MNWLAIINALIGYAWLGGSLWWGWRILASLEKRNDSIATLIDVAMKDAESARQAVEAARTLAAIVQNEQAKIGQGK